MKKRTMAIILSAIMMMTVGMTAAAAGKGDSASHDVKANYVAGAEAETVYSVEIEFGDMNFTYTDQSEGTWNPETHAYENQAAPAWNYNSGNKITVKNHSNAAVTAGLTYTPVSAYSAITGSFDTSSLSLETAEGTTYAAAPAAAAVLTLNGALTGDTAAGTTVGTVTVTIQ